MCPVRFPYVPRCQDPPEMLLGLQLDIWRALHNFCNSHRPGITGLCRGTQARQMRPALPFPAAILDVQLSRPMRASSLLLQAQGTREATRSTWDHVEAWHKCSRFVGALHPSQALPRFFSGSGLKGLDLELPVSNLGLFHSQTEMQHPFSLPCQASPCALFHSPPADSQGEGVPTAWVQGTQHQDCP